MPAHRHYHCFDDGFDHRLQNDIMDIIIIKSISPGHRHYHDDGGFHDHLRNDSAGLCDSGPMPDHGWVQEKNLMEIMKSIGTLALLFSPL